MPTGKGPSRAWATMTAEQRARNRENKARWHKERYANDPEFRARVIAYNKANREKRLGRASRPAVDDKDLDRLCAKSLESMREYRRQEPPRYYRESPLRGC